MYRALLVAPLLAMMGSSFASLDSAFSQQPAADSFKGKNNYKSISCGNVAPITGHINY
jgi:hypothetical protein